MGRRAVVIVLDSVGIGYAEDAEKFDDVGANTLVHIAERFRDEKIPYGLPNMASLGLGNLASMPGVPRILEPKGSYGIMTPRAPCKDTTCGHWEMMGIILKEPFRTFPDGFPKEVVERLETETGHRFIGNKVASGTVIIEELGREHLESGALILYTSADSVLQIAAHEEKIPLEELYRVCRIARRIADEYRIGRVIARPFVGEPGSFRRTSNRHDYSFIPPEKGVQEAVSGAGKPVVGIGKIKDIFAGVGITDSIHTSGNRDGMAKTLEAWGELEEGLLFVNLVDFDMLYGHRRNWKGYGEALMEFDRFLPDLLEEIGPDDLLLITADHGNDPTFKGTDHTRENVPVLVYSPSIKPTDLGRRQTFADLGATVAWWLDVSWDGAGTSFWQ